MDLTPDEVAYLDDLGVDPAELPDFSDEYVDVLRAVIDSPIRLTLDQVLDRRSVA